MTNKQFAFSWFLSVVITALLLLGTWLACSKRHRPPVTTQPAMPTLDEARAAVPDPSRTTTQPASTTEYVLLDLYILEAPETHYGVFIIVALYRGPDGTMAMDVTDDANHKPYKLWMGDANLDGKVDLLDLGMLAGNYGKQIDLSDLNSHPWRAGDFNLDGKVDKIDLGILAGNYGKEN